ncbi:histidyl-tRNA ligase [endosymbiont of Acanthamoeba sp. UWC8]|uniref:histidine--tRNA ligase n=1 Tax=endosymbiont of Acanthamoeba sp. UWC8 TaxID=86106 RepID=UPI0004D197AE|nr:histidine--tRNA ligase [endosymbiont of Acanthamoeba sp. UWC8]AIF80929.1 histidyl-tRNA ligase [endosymbiont of Acanthamoeba sp. UWC8]
MTLLQPIRGTHDIMGADVKLHNHITETAYKIAQNYGYEEIQTPIFERSEVFHRTLGDTSDIVSKETYTFIDRDKTSITLRPEFTAGIARSVISNGLTQNLPQKLFSAGALFRHERPQKCRYRQFHQINFEYIGAKTAYSDIETIALAHEVLSKLGFNEEITLEINTLGDLASRGEYKKALVAYFSKYKEKLSFDSLRRLEKNPLRILDTKDEEDKKIVADAPLLLDYLNDKSKEYYYNLLEGITKLGINYKENPKIVRGMDYYTHTVFEFTTTELGSQGTVLAGGRYDGLVEIMGGSSIPAIGFAAGIERLAELMKLKGFNFPIDKNFYFIAIGEVAEQNAYVLLNNLRKAGFRIFAEYSGNISKRFKKSNSLNAVATLIFGDEECVMNVIKVKNMISGVEETIPLDKLNQYLEKF